MTLAYSLAGAPADVVIDPATGVISGIPAAGGLTSGLVVTATNAADSADSNAFNADIAAVSLPNIADITVVGTTWTDNGDGSYTLNSTSEVTATEHILLNPTTALGPNAVLTITIPGGMFIGPVLSLANNSFLAPQNITFQNEVNDFDVGNFTGIRFHIFDSAGFNDNPPVISDITLTDPDA